jgi:hypothetical protein
MGNILSADCAGCLDYFGLAIVTRSLRRYPWNKQIIAQGAGVFGRILHRRRSRRAFLVEHAASAALTAGAVHANFSPSLMGKKGDGNHS